MSIHINNYNRVISELQMFFIPPPPALKQTCTGYNCICWKDGIHNICIPYDTCLKCYQKLNGLDYCQKCVKI